MNSQFIVIENQLKMQSEKRIYLKWWTPVDENKIPGFTQWRLVTSKREIKLYPFTTFSVFLIFYACKLLSQVDNKVELENQRYREIKRIKKDVATNSRLETIQEITQGKVSESTLKDYIGMIEYLENRKTRAERERIESERENKYKQMIIEMSH
jgi:uncharacterized protein YdbL (DUF1318 family)